MTRRFLGLFALLSLLSIAVSSLVVSCAFSAKERGQNQQYRVLLPWGTGDQYSLQVITLKTLQNITALQGSTAAFSKGYLGPDVRVRVLERGDGVYVPTDSTSSQMLALYAHLERLRELDEVAGAGHLIKRPFLVGMKVKMTAPGFDGAVENNAMYSPKHTALFFAPFHEQTLPMTVNAGIIGHEYFHALFDQLVLRPLQKSIVVEALGESAAAPHESPRVNNNGCPQRPEGEKITPEKNLQIMRDLYHVRLLRAMNEGLADFWGWIYSGDVNFIGRSIPSHGGPRRLDLDQGPVMSFKQFHINNDQTGICGRFSGQGFVYQLGTQYGHWLKEAFKDWERPRIAKMVIEVLPGLAAAGAQLGTSDHMKPALLMELFAKHAKQESPDLCRAILSKVWTTDMANSRICEPGVTL